MRVRATAITQSLVEEVNLSPEELIIYEARVSNPDNQENVETSDKLLRSLIRKKHWSPFDMVNLTVEVKTSKAIAIQILRHWAIKPQEYSQRYSEVPGMEEIEFRFRPPGTSNRQGSNEGTPIGGVTSEYEPYFLGTNPDTEIGRWLLKVTVNLAENHQLYEEGVKLGIANETNRMILPMASSTTMYLNGSVRSWIFYLQQRLDQHAQKEHREVAKAILEVFRKYFPNVCKALEI